LIRGAQKLTICPCCGSKIEGVLEDGCDACGARPVGPPLARPAHELPSYGRSLAVAAAGALLCLTFISKTIAALFEQQTFSLAFWKIMAAAETAAWRLKWLALPLSLVALWASARVRGQLRREPARFAGLRLAHAGIAMSAFVVFAVVILIGITIPARLHQREVARQAAEQAVAYATHRVLLQYSTRFGSLPTTPGDLTRLPDPDGSVKTVRALLETGDYSPEANLAALPPASSSKTRGRRSALRLSNVSAKSNTDDAPRESLSLTNYLLVLPGRDKILNTADDIRIRDGMITPSAPDDRRARTRSASSPDTAVAP
jgi:hypothetical protein